MAKRNFKHLSEREILALAIYLEEEDGRVYGDFAEGFAKRIPRLRKCSKRCRPKNPGTGKRCSISTGSDSAITFH